MERNARGKLYAEEKHLYGGSPALSLLLHIHSYELIITHPSRKMHRAYSSPCSLDNGQTRMYFQKNFVKKQRRKTMHVLTCIRFTQRKTCSFCTTFCNSSLNLFFLLPEMICIMCFQKLLKSLLTISKARHGIIHRAPSILFAQTTKCVCEQQEGRDFQVSI